MAAMTDAPRLASERSPSEIKASIREHALSLGFVSVGFASAAADSPHRQRLPEILEGFVAGEMHGDMHWLAAHADRRSRPQALWPQAGTIVALAMSYAPRHDPMENLARRDRGNISVYARSRDYHDTVKSRLKQLGRWIADRHGCKLKVFVDTAPVMEKPLAAAAGLGWQGKHTNLVSRDHGSWLFLGEIFLALDLPADAADGDHCGSCRACLDICPTAAFPAPYRLDPRRCISYLTIEHKGPIPEEFRAAMGNRIYGCDDCLAVCPWNKFAQASHNAALEPRAALTEPRLSELATLDDAAFRKLFAGTAIKRTGRDRFMRNVAIALGNCDDKPAALQALLPLLADASALVRGAAVWALGRLAPQEKIIELGARHSADEADSEVRTEWARILKMRADLS